MHQCLTDQRVLGYLVPFLEDSSGKAGRKELGRRRERERVNWLPQDSREDGENAKIKT